MTPVLGLETCERPEHDAKSILGGSNGAAQDSPTGLLESGNRYKPPGLVCGATAK
jgi:hypothetical protein